MFLDRFKFETIFHFVFIAVINEKLNLHKYDDAKETKHLRLKLFKPILHHFDPKLFSYINKLIFQHLSLSCNLKSIKEIFYFQK